MEEMRTVVVGVGAAGSVVAAALLSRDPETVLVDPRDGLRDALRGNGLKVSGSLSYDVPVQYAVSKLSETKGFEPTVIFLCTKTPDLREVVDEVAEVFLPGTKVISTHNGLGTEDLIVERFGEGAALRMILNYGVALLAPGQVQVAFFNRPNHLGGICPESAEDAARLATVLTDGGLDTQSVQDVRLYVWKKMIMKCTMASLCALTDKTIQGALQFGPTRELAEVCFREVLMVAKAMGYDLGENYVTEALAYLEEVGIHKDSMCKDVASRSPTEIDFLGGKVVEYARRQGIPAPYYTAVTNLVRGMEDTYLRQR